MENDTFARPSAVTEPNTIPMASPAATSFPPEATRPQEEATLTDAIREPSNTELAYRLAEIKEIVQDAPGRREYTEYQLRVASQFKDQADDITDLRKTHDSDIKDLHRRIDEDHKRRGADWRQLLYSGIAPFAVGILLLIATTWMSKGR